ncbi:MAG: hypothetical protein CL793_07485 [Chloroflexi bacterium]|nr:hypothetical protein [Chloroflexota bacterium]
MAVYISCQSVGEVGEPADRVCEFQRKQEYSIAIGSPAEAYAEATLFVCPKCAHKAFVLTAEVAETTPETLFGGGSNREDHGEPGHETRT